MKDIKLFAFADEASESLDGQIKAMLENDLNGLEIRGVDGVNVSDLTPEKARDVKNALDDKGLVTWSIGSPIGKIYVNGDMAKHLDKFKHTLEIADILGAKNIRIFSFYIPKEVKPEDCREEVLNRMGSLIEAAKGSGINLCHENEKGIYGDVPERCLDLHKTFSDLKGVFDPANFVQCGVDTVKAWNLLKNYIHYMHIKDSRFDGTVVEAGAGDGNIKFLTREYIKNGGRHFTMEPHLVEFNGLAGLEREDEKSLVTAFEKTDERKAFDFACNTYKKILFEA